MPTRVIVERNVAVPMRDGTILRADVYRPDSDAPVPAILARLPYNKDALGMMVHAIQPIRAAEAGFAVVYQDTRGRYASEGQFYPFVSEALDGYDSVEWLARQPWCSGAIGMTGASYFGATQWLTATAQPPHLKAIFPVVTTSEYYESWTYQGGAFQLGFTLLWTLQSLAADSSMRQAAAGEADPDEWVRLFTGVDVIDGLYRHLPMSDLPLLRSSKAADYYFDWMAHETDDAYWQALAINRRYGQVVVPAWNVGGWYDLFLHGTLENYTRMKREGGSEAARQGQRLLVGPWAHGNLSNCFPEHSFGVMSNSEVVDFTALQLKYFGYELRGDDNDFASEPPVRIFTMGENRWHNATDWPLPNTRYECWYLHGDGEGGSSGGALSPVCPSDEEPDFYLYDPRNPTPTIGGPNFLPGLHLGANSGPRDQRAVEARPDVLAYTSARLERPIEVTGPLSVSLWATTNALDTDWVVRLCDVYPDGASRILAEGILRASYREGYAERKLVEPGKPMEYRVNLVATSNLFEIGHWIRVDVCSASFPRFDANPNTGHALGTDTLSDLKPVLQTVFHDAGRASHIVLAIIPR